MCERMAISADVLKIVEKDPFLRLQMRAKEDFNRRHQCFFKLTLERESSRNPCANPRRLPFM